MMDGSFRGMYGSVRSIFGFVGDDVWMIWR